MPTSDQRVSNLLTWYYAAPEDVKSEGRQWYDAQREMIREVAHSSYLPLPTVAAVVAALSPLTRWTQNVAGAIRLIHAYQRDDATTPPRNATLFYRNAVKAWRILDGEAPEVLLSGSPKVWSFYCNLIGDESAVTIDTWMLRAMEEHKDAKQGLKLNRYLDMAADVREAARQVGETAAAFQAIVWVQIRRELSRYDTAKEAAA